MEKIVFLPLCYSFSFETETATLILKIQKWLIPELQKMLRNDTPFMDYMYKTHGGGKELFADFGENGKTFGWNNSILWHEETENEIIYSLPFVPVEISTKEKCPICNGKKNFLQNECYECHGTGKKYIPNNKHFSEGLLSLYSIITFINGVLLELSTNKQRYPFVPQSDKKQLVAVDWSDITSMYNCSISAWFDDSVFEWIKTVPDRDVGLVTKAMQTVEEVLLSKKTNPFDFNFLKYSEETFGLEIPGNACYLSYSHSNDGIGMFGNFGKTLFPHNVDNRLQQVEFLVGLAKINDFVEKYNQKVV